MDKRRKNAKRRARVWWLIAGSSVVLAMALVRMLWMLESQPAEPRRVGDESALTPSTTLSSSSSRFRPPRLGDSAGGQVQRQPLEQVRVRAWRGDPNAVRVATQGPPAPPREPAPTALIEESQVELVPSSEVVAQRTDRLRQELQQRELDEGSRKNSPPSSTSSRSSAEESP
jgi:hypothetical protein